jgi:hypothetical protein
LIPVALIRNLVDLLAFIAWPSRAIVLERE